MSIWTTQYVDLVQSVVGPGGSEQISSCYEDNDGTFEPIDIISGVVVQGAMVYAATSDGVFWEYDTSDPQAVIHLAGYSGPWPRFRKNNNGMAQP